MSYDCTRDSLSIEQAPQLLELVRAAVSNTLVVGVHMKAVICEAAPIVESIVTLYGSKSHELIAVLKAALPSLMADDGTL